LNGLIPLQRPLLFNFLPTTLNTLTTKFVHQVLLAENMTSPVLVVIGSGPGNGLSAASVFASRKFDKIALIARDSARLAKEKSSRSPSCKGYREGRQGFNIQPGRFGDSNVPENVGKRSRDWE
jgi:hypothetical protein